MTTGNNTHIGSETFNGHTIITNPCTIDGMIYVSRGGCYTGLQEAMTAAGNGNTIYIPAGTFNVNTSLLPLQGQTIECAGRNATFLNWRGSSIGTLLDASGLYHFRITNCGITTTTGGPSSIGIYLAQCWYCQVDHDWFTGDPTSEGLGAATGFGTELRVTGDGTSRYSSYETIDDNQFDEFQMSAMNFDHTNDVWLTDNHIYPVQGNTATLDMIIDTGVGGLYVKGLDNNGGGLHSLLVRNTNQGGAYGASPYVAVL